jgi:hypothetical protein
MLESRLVQLERSVVAASAPRNALEGGDAGSSSWLSTLTNLVLLITCGAVLFFQYKAHLHRKQKFF